VRLSLAGAQTLAEGKLNFFGSWTLTRGRFWPIFGTYLMAIILAAVIGLLGFVVAAAPIFAIGGGMKGLSMVMQPNVTTLSAYFTAPIIVYTLIMAFVGAQVDAIVVCPAAAIYRAIKGGEEVEAF
jgi:hypothetical protein